MDKVGDVIDRMCVLSEEELGEPVNFDALVFQARGDSGLAQGEFDHTQLHAFKLDPESTIHLGTFVRTQGSYDNTYNIGVVTKIRTPLPPNRQVRFVIRYCRPGKELPEFFRQSLKLNPKQLLLSDLVIEETAVSVQRVVSADAWFMSNDNGEDFSIVVSVLEFLFLL